MKTPNNPSAFPGESGEDGYGNSKRTTNADGGVSWINLNEGMTLRDYFAAKAMQSLICSESQIRGALAISSGRGEQLTKIVAESAYEYADAMLAERNKKAK